MPLVLAGATSTRSVVDAEIAATRAAAAAPSVHYEVADRRPHRAPHRAGLARVERRSAASTSTPSDQAHTLAAVNVALHAHALLHRDVDYIVRDGKVELIDDSRGRVAQLQRWPDGLQAAVEAKEGLDGQPPTGEVLDPITVQAPDRALPRRCAA